MCCGRDSCKRGQLRFIECLLRAGPVNSTHRASSPGFQSFPRRTQVRAVEETGCQQNRSKHVCGAHNGDQEVSKFPEQGRLSQARNERSVEVAAGHRHEFVKSLELSGRLEVDWVGEESVKRVPL